MLGVKGDVVSVIPLVVVGRVGSIAVLLLLGDEGPFLIELDLTRPGGKGHEFVVDELSMVARQAAVTSHGIAMYPTSRSVSRTPLPSAM